MRDYPPDFKPQCCGRLEYLGDSVMNAEEYDEAILQYTVALSLNPVAPQDLLRKRSKAHASEEKWEDVLNDANEVARFSSSSFCMLMSDAQLIMLDLSSTRGSMPRYMVWDAIKTQ